MNNLSANARMVECSTELDELRVSERQFGNSDMARYIRSYAVIRACGTIEWCIKRIIADKADEGASDLIKVYIESRVRLSSMNPRLDRIKDLIKSFSSQWSRQFQQSLALANRAGIESALKSLVDARNSFAHGGMSTLSVLEISEAYQTACELLRIADDVVSRDYAEESSSDAEEAVE